MFIFWKGSGLGTAFTAVVGLAVVFPLYTWITGDHEMAEPKPWLLGVGMLISALANYIFCRDLDYSEDHSLFFIPVRRWTFIYLAIGVVFCALTLCDLVVEPEAQPAETELIDLSNPEAVDE